MEARHCLLEFRSVAPFAFLHIQHRQAFVLGGSNEWDESEHRDEEMYLEILSSVLLFCDNFCF